MADGVGKFAFLDVLDPDAKDPDRHVVLFFAGNGAGVTADTAVVVDNKTAAHYFP